MFCINYHFWTKPSGCRNHQNDDNRKEIYPANHLADNQVFVAFYGKNRQEKCPLMSWCRIVDCYLMLSHLLIIDIRKLHVERMFGQKCPGIQWDINVGGMRQWPADAHKFIGVVHFVLHHVPDNIDYLTTIQEHKEVISEAIHTKRIHLLPSQIHSPCMKHSWYWHFCHDSSGCISCESKHCDANIVDYHRLHWCASDQCDAHLRLRAAHWHRIDG